MLYDKNLRYSDKPMRYSQNGWVTTEPYMAIPRRDYWGGCIVLTFLVVAVLATALVYYVK